MSLTDAVQQFESKDYKYFHVEYTERGDDLIYHFWPPGDDGDFIEHFHRRLEDAFIKVLPSSMRVQADYTSLKESTVQHMHGAGVAVPQKDADKDLVVPRATYYVRVIDGLQNPLAGIFLKQRVFDTLDAEIKEHA
jgi:hypothetical protein